MALPTNVIQGNAAHVTHHNTIHALMPTGESVMVKTKAGAPVDGDFTSTPANGTLALNTTNGRLYARISGTWTEVSVGSSAAQVAIKNATNTFTLDQTFDANIAVKGPRPWVDVRAYGAVGDGVANDTAAIQAALDSVPAFTGDYRDQITVPSGGTVFLPRGIYKTTAPLIVGAYQSLIGAGTGCSIIKNTSTTTAAIKIGTGATTVNNVIIRDLTIAGIGGGSASPGAHGIWAQNLHRSYIENVWLNNVSDNGIWLDGCSYTYILKSHIYGSRGYGIRLDHDGVDPLAYATASYIKDCTVRESFASGIFFNACVQCYINNCTLESNGVVGEAIGYTGSLSSPRAVNLYMKGAVNCVVRDSYFEQSSAYTNQTEIAMAGGYNNIIVGCGLNNFVGLFLWSSLGGSTCATNMIRDNFFNVSVNPNCIADQYAGAVYPNDNWFADNVGMNFNITSENFHGNVITAGHSGDGLARRIEAGSGATHTPDGGLITGVGNIAAGRRKGRIITTTLTQAHFVAVPVTTTFADGEELTFVFLQDGTGGRAVTWSSAYKHNWSDTGNTAGKRSTISFVLANGTWCQLGAQSPYV